MHDYLPDATDFTDLPVLDVPSAKFPDMVGPWVHCPVCHGHGYWNLRLNAYGKPGDPPAQRHFRAFCRQCWSWGWVKTESTDSSCVHEFKEIAPDQPWRCWHTIKCTKCGETRSYDSSD